MASMRASHAFLPPHPSATGKGQGLETASGGASRRAKCRAGLSMLVGVLSVLQTHYMRGIHGRILTHYAGTDTTVTTARTKTTDSHYYNFSS